MLPFAAPRPPIPLLRAADRTRQSAASVPGERIGDVTARTAEVPHILDAAQFSAAWLLDELFPRADTMRQRSEEHTSELQSRQYLVCRLLLEKKKNNIKTRTLGLS